MQQIFEKNAWKVETLFHGVQNFTFSEASFPYGKLEKETHSLENHFNDFAENYFQ